MADIWQPATSWPRGRKVMPGSNRPSQRLVNVFFAAFVIIGVLNFFSPAVGIPREPEITWGFVGLAGILFGFTRSPKDGNGEK